LAPNRTGLYTIWRVCERFGILPPGIKNEFFDNLPWQQAQMMAYEQIRSIEEAEARVTGQFKL